MDIRLGALALILAGSTCLASDRILIAQPTANQLVEYKAGSPYVVSTAESTTVVFAPDIESKSKASLWFTVRNMGSAPITVFDGAVSAKSSGKSIDVLGVAELTKKEKRRKFWENLGAGLAAGANSYTAAQSGHSTIRSNHYGTATAYTRNSSIDIDYQGTTTTNIYDPEANRRAVADANSRNTQMLANIRAEQAGRSAALETNVLQSQTIRPGEAYSGFVQMLLPRAVRGEASMVEVGFAAGPDRHHFFIFLDGQPSQYQRAQIDRNPYSKSETVKVSATQSPVVATAKPQFQPKQQPQAIPQPTARRIESPSQSSGKWSAESIEIVNGNCKSQLAGGREVEEKTRTQYAFACICMTRKLQNEISFDELVQASELSVEEQQTADVNVLVRTRLKECAKEYSISLK